MTIEEFSSEFDVLLSSYNFILDEYEKSILLTEAQEEVVKDLYNGRLTGSGFETTEEQRRNLDNLVKTYVLSKVTSDVPLGVSEYSQFFVLPTDVWFITYESAILSDSSLKCNNDSRVEVYPIRQDEYHNIKDNPFRGASEKRVLRIDTGSSKIELISKYNIAAYYIKYLSRPKPIILVDISDDGLSINDETQKSNCTLNSVLHRTILERAVALAIKRLPSK